MKEEISYNINAILRTTIYLKKSEQIQGLTLVNPYFLKLIYVYHTVIAYF